MVASTEMFSGFFSFYCLPDSPLLRLRSLQLSMASRQDHELIYWREWEVFFQDYHNVRRGYDLAWCCCQNLTCRLES